MSTRRSIRTTAAALGFLPAVLVWGCGDEAAAPLPISVAVLPSGATVPTGGTQDFTATVDNDPADKGVTWTVTGSGCSGAACGTISSAGSASGTAVTYTAPATAPDPATVTVTATSVADHTKSAAASVTIGVIGVSVSPSEVELNVGATQHFTATVVDDPANQGVTWTLTGSGCSGATCGTIAPTSSASGASVVYTAPATAPDPGTVTVTAISVTDRTKSASATVTVASISVSVSPTSATVPGNRTEYFTATVHNDPSNEGVSWSLTGSGCSDDACGTISTTIAASGDPIAYTAPAAVPTPPIVTLTATAVADYTKSAVATVTIVPPPPPVLVSVTPTLPGVDVNGSQEFIATLTNDVSDAGVTWTVSGDGCSGAACGIIAPTSSTSGVPVTYTAPSTVPTPATVTVTAVSVADPSGAASATAVITTPGEISVVVFPGGARLRRGGSIQFTAYVFNDPSTSGVDWSVGSGSVSPTSSASGEAVTYTAPTSGGSTFVRATSIADPTRSATVTVSLTSSCPLVYSWDGTTWRLDSGTFGGAIVRALEKTDIDNLDFATPQDGLLRLKVADELAETDYVDELTVLAVDHDSGMTVAPDGTGRLYGLGSLTSPQGARDFRGDDVLDLVSAVDGRNWESSPVVRDTATATDLRDGIELTYPRPAGARAARLVLDGNNSPWAAAMMLAYVSAHGRKTQAWYDSLDAAPKQTRQMFATLLREASLRVSVWAAGRWEPQGAVWEAGPEVTKRQVVPLDLSRVEGDTVRVRLESVPDFWLVDQVALDFSAAHPLRVTELSPTSALDEREQDVRDPLAVPDDRFFTMEPGDFAEVHYQVPEIPPGQARTFLLRSAGYYRIDSPEAGEPDMTLLNAVLTEPSAISRISIARMNQALLAMERTEP